MFLLFRTEERTHSLDILCIMNNGLANTKLYVCHTWKKISKTKATKKLSLLIRRIFPLILAILRRFLPLCIVFSPISTATSCQDADFFPGMMYMHLERLERQAGREWNVSEFLQNLVETSIACLKFQANTTWIDIQYTDCYCHQK